MTAYRFDASAHSNQKFPMPNVVVIMRRVATSFVLSTLTVSMITAVAAESPIRRGPRLVKPGVYGIGRQIPDLTFTDVDGTQHRLSDFGEQKAVVLAMTGTGCPLCLKYSPSLSAIEQKYRDRGVTFVFINPNESEGTERVRKALDANGFQGPYVRDSQMQLASALGAKTTTEVFVIDRARTLVYRGAVDDQHGIGYSLESPRKNFLTNALDSLLEGKPMETLATTSPGCELYYDTTVESDSNVTYHNRISRIIQSNCIECHRDGENAPIPLESYAEVRDYVGMIQDVVRRGVMPPWFAAPQPIVKNDADTQSDGEAVSHSLHWSNDRSLSDQDKHDLFTWIESGVPEGDPADAPLPRSFPDGWLIGEPDVVFEFPKPQSVRATGTMPYKNVTVETDLPEDKWVQAIQIRPGKLDVVHHVIVTIKGDPAGSRSRDAFWSAYAPGNGTFVYPSGYARRLPRGAKLNFQMHYTPNGTATKDSTRIGLIFATEPPKHEVKMLALANHSFKIPPGDSNHRVQKTQTLPFDVQILGFLPHMHLRGKAARYATLTPDGKERDVLLDVPNYDFNWQLFYRLARPQTLPRGEAIRFTGWFDNSDENPANPNPNATVRWGEQTEDEMHLGYIEYVVSGESPSDLIASTQGSESTADTPRSVATERSGSRSLLNAASLVRALRQLDTNQDGQLEIDEVPTKHHSLFERLDSNGDDLLTAQEVKAAIRRIRNQSR